MPTLALRRKSALAALVGGSLVASPFVLAGVAHAAPGTIKVAEVGSPVVNANDPKVCKFVIRAFGFTQSDGQNVAFAINPVGNTGQPTQPFAASGMFAINGDGFGQSPPLELPNGQYKAFVQEVDAPADIENGGSKKKVFTVDCEDPGGNADPDNPVPDLEGEGEPEPEADDNDNKKKNKKKDRDDGPNPVGGVNTGGGGNALPRR